MQGLIAVAVIAFIAGIAVMYQLDDTNEEVTRSKLCTELTWALEDANSEEDWESGFLYMDTVWAAALVMGDTEFEEALGDIMNGLAEDSKFQYDNGAERIVEMCS